MASSTKSRNSSRSGSSMADLQKRSRVVSPDDRISNLPDSILCDILSFLPTKLAVQSSILGRRWRFLWTEVPALDFTCSDYRKRNEEDGGTMNFVQAVNSVLIHRDYDAEDLEKFRLHWRGMKSCEAVCVNAWASYAIARNVRSLDLEILFAFCTRSDLVVTHLPSALFTSGTLEFLNLYGPILVKVPCKVYLPKLKVLKLNSVYYEWDESVEKVVCLPELEVLDLISVHYESDESVETLISGCPVLHSLKMVRSAEDKFLAYKIYSPSLRCLVIEFTGHWPSTPVDGKIEINAPGLEFLSLKNGGWKECTVKRLTSVNRVDLALDVDRERYSSDFSSEVYIDRCNLTVKLVEAVNSANFLTLKGTIMKGLSHATTPLSTCFQRLTELKIECKCCQWSALNALLVCLIKLKVLAISMEGCGDCSTYTSKQLWEDPKDVPECLSCSLEQVSWKGLQGQEDEIALIRHFLKHGAVLTLINLELDCYSCIYGNYQRKFDMLRKIAMVPRFSRTCELQFR